MVFNAYNLCIDTVLRPYQLTRSDDVNARFLVIPMDKDKNIEKVVAGLYGWVMF